MGPGEIGKKEEKNVSGKEERLKTGPVSLFQVKKFPSSFSSIRSLVSACGGEEEEEEEEEEGDQEFPREFRPFCLFLPAGKWEWRLSTHAALGECGGGLS